MSMIIIRYRSIELSFSSRQYSENIVKVLNSVSYRWRKVKLCCWQCSVGDWPCSVEWCHRPWHGKGWHTSRRDPRDISWSTQASTRHTPRQGWAPPGQSSRWPSGPWALQSLSVHGHCSRRDIVGNLNSGVRFRGGSSARLCESAEIQIRFQVKITNNVIEVSPVYLS